MTVVRKSSTLCCWNRNQWEHSVSFQELVYGWMRLVQDQTINQNHAQLSFTTHDTGLLDLKLLRRDQIWCNSVHLIIL